MQRDHQHYMLMREAVDLHNVAPDLPDYDVIETCLKIVSHPHNFSSHDDFKSCVLCRSIILAYDESFEVARKYYDTFTRPNNDERIFGTSFSRERRVL